MELKFDKCSYYINNEGFWLSLRIINVNQAKEFLNSMKEKLHIAIVKVFRNKRSLDANAYLWVLLQKMAENLGNTTKDELYLQVLERYGVFTHVIVKPEVVDRTVNEWRTSKVLGEVTVNGKKGVQIQCYFGSSTYDTKEMSRLIDGVVSECKELNIQTLTPDELERMKGEWGSEAQKNKSN